MVTLGDYVLRWTTGSYHSDGGMFQPFLGAIAGAFVGLLIEVVCRWGQNRFRFRLLDYFALVLLLVAAQAVLTPAARYAVNYPW